MKGQAVLSDVILGASYCSYRVGGPIDAPYLPKTLDEALAVLRAVPEDHQSLTVLGGGSNTIIASQGIRGATFIAKRLMFAESLGERTFRIGAGMPLAKICYLAEEHGFSGAEFMIGVPGTLGGAVAMNAGAMGQDTAGVLDHAILWNRKTGQVETWEHPELAFSYRWSAIEPRQMIILAAQLTFHPGEASAIRQLIEKSLAFRKAHHPKEPNGGSVFKNPTLDMPAGRLLDESGAKGWRFGDAMVSPLHANFIVNVGHATSTDVLTLMLRMKHALSANYGVDVHPENRFMGDATDHEQAMWEELTGHAWTS